MTYEIMHADTTVALLTDSGKCSLLKAAFLPWDLWLEESDDFDVRVNNMTNFYYWCATRVLTLDRVYAKEILNSIGAAQAATDRDKAAIALSYHCLTLTDVFWVRETQEKVSFKEINLYENHLSNALVGIALQGRHLTVENAHLIATDVSTGGVFPKAWVRREDGFWLYKDGSPDAVERELLASRICRCFDCRQVVYTEAEFDGRKTTASRLMTGLSYSIATREAFEIYAVNRGIDPLEYILELDAHGFYMMNILDYLTGNSDRHWGNWGFLIDNASGEAVRLHDLMDFNQCFKAYETLEGTACQPLFGRHITQQQAAEQAVRADGLHQISPVEEEWFGGHKDYYEMFSARLKYLTGIAAGD